MRLRVLDDLRALVSFDAHVWLLTDPVTSVGTSPLADVPCLPELPALIRLKYQTRLHRWTALATAGRGAGLLHRDTAGDLARSLVWREMLCQYGVVDVASVVFHDRFGCWGFLELWRLAPGEPFVEDDRVLLDELAAPLTRALRRCQAATFALPHRGATRRVEPAVLVLSGDLEVTSRTAATHPWLLTLVPPEHGRPPVPSGAYNVAAQLLAHEAGVDPHPPFSRVHLSDGLWVTLRAARLDGGGHGDEIAVTIEQTSPNDRLDVFCRASGLSDRERELLGHLAVGSDTRVVASRMSVSEHTVQDHLKSVFAKTGVRNRRALLSRVLGAQP